MINKNNVRVVIFKKNRQVIIKKVKPKNNSFDYDSKSYIIDSENYYIHKKLATYSFLEGTPIPLSIKDIKIQHGQELVEYDDILMSSDELNIFKRSKTAREILDTIDKGLPENIFGIISIAITLIGFAGLYFVLSEQINAIMQSIIELRNALGIQ
jgi:hypothetical protein